MNRFRTGRPAPPWAGDKIGPMTVDVEALWANHDQNHIVKVIPMARDGRDLENPAAALKLDVRKDRSNIIYPASGQIESVAKQRLLPGSAQNIESDVTT